jgi:hypothetical protein
MAPFLRENQLVQTTTKKGAKKERAHDLKNRNAC